MVSSNQKSNPETVKSLPIIGNNALVTIHNISNIPAKIDTGADSSALWASNLAVTDDGRLEFTLFGPSSPLYTGEKISLKDYSVQQVRNSTGHITLRYRVYLTMKVKNRKIRTNFNLYNRSNNRFPVLIGRKTLQNKFLVDVSKIAVPRPPTLNNVELNAELKANPQAFHKKYMEHN